MLDFVYIAAPHYHTKMPSAVYVGELDVVQVREKIRIFYESSRSSNSSPLDISEIFSGCSLVIRDLTEWPEDNWARHYCPGIFFTKGEEYLKLYKILLAREAAWTVAQSLEAFERFLKDILATMLLNKQHVAETKKVKKFESDKKNDELNKSYVIF